MKRFKNPKNKQTVANKPKNWPKKLSYNRGSPTPSLLKSLHHSIDTTGKNQDRPELKMGESIKHETKCDTSPDEVESPMQPSGKNRVMATRAHH